MLKLFRRRARERVRNAYLSERLIFVIDRSGIEGHPRAQREAFGLAGDSDAIVMSDDYD